ncbi:formate/nitrite transporter family protein [Halosimplex aquaticum]
MSPRTPTELFEHSVEEGERRLDQSLLELASTSFIAGFTIVFGVVALGIVEAFVEPTLGHVAKVAGALAFGIGVVFLVAGRTELFNENFADPTAAAVERPGFSAVPALVRLWVVTFALNLVGGCLFALVFAVEEPSRRRRPRSCEPSPRTRPTDRRWPGSRAASPAGRW